MPSWSISRSARGAGNRFAIFEAGFAQSAAQIDQAGAQHGAVSVERGDILRRLDFADVGDAAV